MKKHAAWLFWFAVSAALDFIGWATIAKSLLWGRFIMSLGFLLGGFLIVFAAYKSLNKIKEQEKTKH